MRSVHIGASKRQHATGTQTPDFEPKSIEGERSELALHIMRVRLAQPPTLFSVRMFIFNSSHAHAHNPQDSSEPPASTNKHQKNQHRRPARSADRVGDVAMVELHTLCGKTVDVWGVVYSSTVSTNCLGCMVIGKDEDNVGTFWLQSHDMYLHKPLG